MISIKRTASAAAFCVALAGLCPAAEAQDQQAVPVAAQAAPPFEVEALDDGKLQVIAGREDTNQTTIANLQAGVSHNSVGNNVQTGDARISDNAFQNLSGLSILNVNTGNNVAINAALSVNISISPGQ